VHSNPVSPPCLISEASRSPSLEAANREGVNFGPSGMQARSGAYSPWLSLKPQRPVGRSESSLEASSRRVQRIFVSGTRNAEPHIAVFEASARTTDDKISAVVEMRGSHRHRRRGLRLQTRRLPSAYGAVGRCGVQNVEHGGIHHRLSTCSGHAQIQSHPRL
jgi:hypothetical protein